MHKGGVSFLWGLILCYSLAVPALEPDFVSIVKENEDSVVEVFTSTQRPIIKKPSDADGLGTGFVISEDGYIVTNKHVIKNAEQIWVRTKKHQKFPATLIGISETMDLALLKIKESNLKQVKIGSSSLVQKGEWVLAIGSMYGFELSVTHGIISDKERFIFNQSKLPYLQTDAVTNVGNSGGPLFDRKGNVIGINSFIYSSTEGFQGLSFAIPIDVAMPELELLKNGKKTSSGWLGIKTKDFPPQGVLISSFVFPSPAKNAGIKLGDIIMSFNGQLIENSADLASKLKKISAGTSIDLEIIRQAQKQRITVKAGINQD